LCQLEIRRPPRVSETMADAENPRVATGTLRVPGGDGLEQLARHFRPRHEARDVTSSRDVTALGKGDQPLGKAARLLGLGHGRLDTLVLEQRSHEIPQQGAPMRRGATELALVLAVSHVT